MNEYRTLLRDASAEVVIQKSRFIGRAAPVNTPEAALALLDGVKQEHREASHHCYAYILGQNMGVMRYSDDGEPGGTAGMPILEGLKLRGLVNAAVVVTRYFGGVLLGAGGLTRAYANTCGLAVQAAGVCVMTFSQRWLCEVEYPRWDRVQHALKSLPVKVENQQFATTVQFELLCRERDVPETMAALTRVTDGRLETLLMEETYAAWEDPAAGEAEPGGSV